MPEHDEPSTTAVIERCIAGEPNSWEELVRLFNPLVWTVARSFSLTQADCEDVCQHTWTQLVGRLATLHSPDRLSAWLVTTARRESLRLTKHARRSMLVPFLIEVDPPSDQVATPEELAIADARRSALLRGFRELPSRQQALMELLSREPRPSYQQIGEMLGMPVGTIGPTRQRILRRLAEYVRDDDGRKGRAQTRELCEPLR
ncbi:sigma-70 family RNA polymerase sigma factor [Actinoallomurus purpureus]|uniref:RNA polymerase sigma factor n=1 Tax=Actinoallomurus purpureus TaxID=478114 RepID=UPI002091EAE3|nr:sigma-70 family RNA polymerase sigma factor [Actinoallomurus purpureus]MCO6010997.1 sigma-70 family RNA polymerase sigma factor [Actinoallomurus purpureus]